MESIQKITNLIKESSVLYTVENHFTNGGLADLVSETFNRSVNRIGLRREFITEYGSYEDLRRVAGMDTNSILEKLPTT